MSALLRQPFYRLTLLVLFFSSPSWAGPLDNDPLKKALFLSEQEKWAEAVPEFQRAANQDPKNAMTWANLGVALSRVDQHKDALLAYETAANLGYDNAPFRYNRGLSFARINLLEEAERELKIALDKDPRMAKAEYDLGIVYKLMGRPDAAMERVRNLYFGNNKLAHKLFDQVQPYKIASIDNGGALTGKAFLKGPVPKPRSFHLVHSPNIEFCSRISDGQGHRLVYDFVASEKGEFKDVVIAIMGVRKGKPFSEAQKKPAFKVNRCHSDQYAMGINNGENVMVENFDPIEHEIVSYEIHNPRVFQKSNKQILAKSTQIHSAFLHPDAREYFITCNLHNFIQTHGLVVGNPYYAVTDDEGRFSIQDIPPGTYEVLAWHPYIPTQKGTVTIHPNQEAQIDFVFNGEDEKRKLYQDDLKGYRFQPWYDNANTFYGRKRVDDPVEILQEPAMKYYNRVTPQEIQQSPPLN
ncbi:MAG: tetratricopeptide repeat protein [Nitrospinae bacterium]|nr:tetratricopeptide repeat protein [Nitrospinota bacterium]